MYLTFLPIEDYDLGDGTKFLAIRKDREEKTDYTNLIYWAIQKNGKFYRKNGVKKWVYDSGITHFSEKPQIAIRKFRHPTDKELQNLTREKALDYLNKEPRLLPQLTQLMQSALRKYREDDYNEF